MGAVSFPRTDVGCAHAVSAASLLCAHFLWNAAVAIHARANQFAFADRQRAVMCMPCCTIYCCQVKAAWNAD